MTANVKWCGGCEQFKDTVEFSRDTSRSTGLQHYCKVCNSTYFKRTRKHGSQHQTSVAIRAAGRYRALRRKYGISVKDYEKLLAKQNGVCAICGEGEDDQRWGCLYVDHDHETGQVRGLLCRNCNLALGLFRDNPTFLKRAIRYLRIQP